MWFYLSLLSAFLNSLGNVARRTHGSLAQPAELAWWSQLFSLPLTVGLVVIEHGAHWKNYDFMVPAIAAALLGCFGGCQLFRAYKYANASVVSPLANILPVAMIITSFFILGVLPNVYGLLGILLVVGGVYYSSVSGKHSLVRPLQQLTQNKGSRAMLYWVAITAVSVVLTSIALRSATPSFLLLFTNVVGFVVLSGYMIGRRARHKLRHDEFVFKKWGWHMVAISLFSTLGIFFQYQAMDIIDPSYVMAVKRLDVLMTIVLAGLFLREKHILKRFKGSVAAVVGVMVILFFG